MIESPGSRMSGADVAALYARCEAAGIRIWIDGGWGVDALLGEVTRAHGDLDIAMEAADVKRLRELLAADGYREVARPGASAWNFVLENSAGWRVDVHAVAFDAAGGGVLGPVENGHVYPVGSLTGTGVIAGQTVRCVAAESVLQFRAGYPPRDRDRHDVRLLCERFGLAPPEAYR